MKFQQEEKISYDNSFIFMPRKYQKEYVEQIKLKKIRCPACNGIIKYGVNDRIESIATTERRNLNRPQYFNIVPLVDIIAIICNRKNQSKTVQDKYNNLISKIGPELDILIKLSVDR